MTDQTPTLDELRAQVAACPGSAPRPRLVERFEKALRVEIAAKIVSADNRRHEAWQSPWIARAQAADIALGPYADDENVPQKVTLGIDQQTRALPEGFEKIPTNPGATTVNPMAGRDARGRSTDVKLVHDSTKSLDEIMATLAAEMTPARWRALDALVAAKQAGKRVVHASSATRRPPRSVTHTVHSGVAHWLAVRGLAKATDLDMCYGVTSYGQELHDRLSPLRARKKEPRP